MSTVDTAIHTQGDHICSITACGLQLQADDVCSVVGGDVKGNDGYSLVGFEVQVPFSTAETLGSNSLSVLLCSDSYWPVVKAHL